jgi:hypothetical protein
VLLDAGDAERVVAGADGDHQPVVVDREAPVDPDAVADDAAVRRVDLLALRLHVVEPLLRLADRLDDAAELDGPDRRARQQGSEQEVVARADEVDVIVTEVDPVDDHHGGEAAAENHQPLPVAGRPLRHRHDHVACFRSALSLLRRPAPGDTRGVAARLLRLGRSAHGTPSSIVRSRVPAPPLLPTMRSIRIENVETGAEVRNN